MAFEAFEGARFAMGDTVRYAGQVGLVEMEPRGDLCSTGYALANPSVEYLALQPAPNEAFNLSLELGDYSVAWFDVDNREAVAGEDVKVREAGAVSFSAPFEGGPSVLHLKAT